MRRAVGPSRSTERRSFGEIRDEAETMHAPIDICGIPKLPSIVPELTVPPPLG